MSLFFGSQRPKVTHCPKYDRDWVHVEPPRYYLSQTEAGKWQVIDVTTDFPVTPPFRTKGFAVSYLLRTSKKSKR